MTDNEKIMTELLGKWLKSFNHLAATAKNPGTRRALVYFDQAASETRQLFKGLETADGPE